MMVNPTKGQKKLREIYENEVVPWLYVDIETGKTKFKKGTPQDIKDKYELYINS